MTVLYKETFLQEGEIEKFSEWLDQFQLSGRTHRLYVGVAKTFLKEHRKLSQSVVNKFIKERPRYYVKSAMKYLIEYKLGYEKASSFRFLNIKPPTKKLKERPSRAKLKEILDKMDYSKLKRDTKYLLEFLIMTGYRCGEALNMRVDNIDFENNKVRLKVKGDRYREARLPKEYLGRVYKWCIKDRGLLGGERVFFNSSKTVKSAYYTLQYDLKRVGCDDVDLILKTHNFRSAMINHILDLTDDNLFKAYAFIGHKKIDTTMKYVTKRKKEKAVEEVYKKLNEVSK